MNDQEINNVYRTLHLLSLRKSPKQWKKIKERGGANITEFVWIDDNICLICNQVLYSQYEKHGLQHLKEYNLLPFL